MRGNAEAGLTLAPLECYISSTSHSSGKARPSTSCTEEEQGVTTHAIRVKMRLQDAPGTPVACDAPQWPSTASTAARTHQHMLQCIANEQRHPFLVDQAVEALTHCCASTHPCSWSHGRRAAAELPTSTSQHALRPGDCGLGPRPRHPPGGADRHATALRAEGATLSNAQQHCPAKPASSPVPQTLRSHNTHRDGAGERMNTWFQLRGTATWQMEHRSRQCAAYLAQSQEGGAARGERSRLPSV